MSKVVNFKMAQIMVEGMAKDGIKFPVIWKGELKDKMVTQFPKFDNEDLTWKWLASDEVELEFAWAVGGYDVLMGKAGKVIAGYIVKDGKIQFGGLSAQGIFKVLNKLTNVSISKLDGLYKMANTGRKDGKSKIVKEEVAW